MINFLVFPQLRIYLFPLYFWRIYLDIEFWVDIFFLPALKKRSATFSVFHGFWWEILGHLICFSPIGEVSFFSDSSQYFSLPLVFRKLIMMCLGVIFFGFILFGIQATFWIWRIWGFVLSAKFRKFSVINSLTTFFFKSLPPFFSFWDYNDMDVISLVIIIHFPKALFFFYFFHILPLVQMK